MRARLVCVCAWLAWGSAAALHGATLRADAAGGAATSHHRFKRYLIFPEGSSIGVTVVWAESYELNTPDVWFLTGDITTVYELPDHYIRKKLYVNNEPTTSAPAVQDHHHHPDFVLKSHQNPDIHYPSKHHEFQNDVYIRNTKEQNFDYGCSKPGHETPHFAEYFQAYPRKRKQSRQTRRHRFQRHLLERKNWHSQLQALLKEMPQTQGWNDETPKMCEVAKASCAISFLN